MLFMSRSTLSILTFCLVNSNTAPWHIYMYQASKQRPVPRICVCVSVQFSCRLNSAPTWGFGNFPPASSSFVFFCLKKWNGAQFPSSQSHTQREESRVVGSETIIWTDILWINKWARQSASVPFSWCYSFVTMLSSCMCVNLHFPAAEMSLLYTCSVGLFLNQGYFVEQAPHIIIKLIIIIVRILHVMSNRRKLIFIWKILVKLSLYFTDDVLSWCSMYGWVVWQSVDSKGEKTQDLVTCKHILCKQTRLYFMS